MNHRFPNWEKLKSRKTIDKLFSDRKSYTKYPLKVFFIPKPEEKTHQVAFSVPKRNFKLAVDRNRIKRQMREVYRLNKTILNNAQQSKYAMLFLFIAKEKPTYSSLEKTMVQLLEKLNNPNK